MEKVQSLKKSNISISDERDIMFLRIWFGYFLFVSYNTYISKAVYEKGYCTSRKTLFEAYYILDQNIMNCKYTFLKNQITA